MAARVAARTPARRMRPRLRFGDAIALLAGVALVLMFGAALVGPLFLADPTAQELSDRLIPPAWLDGGNPKYLLGTDHLGRDILSRIISGARISFVIGGASLALSAAFGILVGLLSGYFRGLMDDLVMRIVDVQLSIPYVLLAMTVVAVLGPSLQTVVLALLLYGWVVYARLVRGQVLALREQEFVIATRSLGASDLRIVALHLLPNLVTPLIVVSTLELANLIIIESALGFLGLGVPPPTATLGGIIADGREYLTAGVWWIAVAPGALIVLLILSINLVGDWLRDRLDPRSASSS